MTLYSVRVHNLSGIINPEGPKLRFVLVKLQDCCEKEEEEKKILWISMQTNQFTYKESKGFIIFLHRCIIPDNNGIIC